MTNEQLSVMLLGLLSELDTVIDEARAAMPEAAEREQYAEWERKPEYRDALFLFHVDERTHDKVTRQGEYVALLPLVALQEAWAERFGALETEADVE